MSDLEPTPRPEPRGDLVPPTRHPPTAVGVATPPPPPPPRALPRPRYRRGLLATLRAGLDAALDAADSVGDAIREAIGLDRRPGTAVRRVDPDA